MSIWCQGRVEERSRKSHCWIIFQKQLYQFIKDTIISPDIPTVFTWLWLKWKLGMSLTKKIFRVYPPWTTIACTKLYKNHWNPIETKYHLPNRTGGNIRSTTNHLVSPSQDYSHMVSQHQTANNTSLCSKIQLLEQRPPLLGVRKAIFPSFFVAKTCQSHTFEILTHPVKWSQLFYTVMMFPNPQCGLNLRNNVHK